VDFKREVYRRALRYFAPLVEAACSVEVGVTPAPGSGRSAAA
jgi:hypothetical protein